MKIGIIGSGIVGISLANGLIKENYTVQLATNTASKIDELKSKLNPEIQVSDFAHTAAWAELIILATKGQASLEALKICGEANIANKIIIDTTNPIAETPVADGLISFYTDGNQSQMELLQAHFPSAHFVKAFNSVGSSHMIHPQFSEGKPSMFICGNRPEAKLEVGKLLEKIGWEVEDCGVARAARIIEPLCILWCQRGFRDNSWNHAFKLLKK